MVKVAGIDAAWSQKNPSGVAILSVPPAASGKPVFESSHGLKLVPESSPSTGFNPELKLMLEGVHLVAVDMPLAPELINGVRECDRAISREFGRYKAGVRPPTPTNPGSYGLQVYRQLCGCGGTFLTTMKHLEDFRGTVESGGGPAQFGFFEVYPHAALIRILHLKERFAYKEPALRTEVRRDEDVLSLKPELQRKDFRNLRWTRLQALYDLLKLHIELPESFAECFRLKCSEIEGDFGTNTGAKQVEDQIDALICGLVAAKLWQGQAEPFGSEHSAIWVPRSSDNQ